MSNATSEIIMNKASDGSNAAETSNMPNASDVSNVSIQLKPSLYPTEQQQVTSAQPKVGRFAFIDGLRGLAALAVVFFHLYMMAKLNDKSALNMVPSSITQMLSHGDCGVQVFFTLSGFVIAHSLRNLQTKKEALTFMIKRFIRLCPAYWVVLVAIFFGAQIMGHAGMTTSMNKLTCRDLFASMFYCQYIAHSAPVLGPAWTLVMEMGFYLTMSGLIVACTFLKKPQLRSSLTTLFLFLIGMLQLPGTAHAGWSLFVVGYLAYTKMNNAKFSNLFFVLLGGIFAVAVCFASLPSLIGGLTAATIYAAFKFDKMNKWLSKPHFQYLGTISYSLYLVNMNVCALSTKLADKFSHDNLLLNFVLLGATVVACISTADLLYRVAEAPSHRLSKAFKL